MDSAVIDSRLVYFYRKKYNKAMEPYVWIIF